MFRYAAISFATACLLLGGISPAAAQSAHDLEVTAPDGFSARVRVIEGSTSTLEHGGQKFGFAVRSGGNAETEVEVRRLLVGSTDTRGTAVQILELPRGVPAATHYGWTVKLISSARGSSDVSTMNGETCCVKCGQTTVCSCAVVMSCGRCCVGECCEALRAPWERETDLASLGSVWARDMYRRPCPAEHSLSAALSFVPERRS